MARTKEYDRQDVLSRAAELFWMKGYKATSMAEVVQATGLNTASLYKEFGDKDGLFEESLAYYREHILGPRFRILTEEPDLEGVAAFLDSVIRGAASDRYKGCLMMNHLAQKASISPRAAVQIGDLVVAIEALLTTAFRNAQAKGDIPDDRDPALLASFVMCCVHGLVLYGRHPQPKKRLPGFHDMILRALKA